MILACFENHPDPYLPVCKVPAGETAMAILKTKVCLGLIAAAKSGLLTAETSEEVT